MGSVRNRGIWFQIGTGVRITVHHIQRRHVMFVTINPIEPDINPQQDGRAMVARRHPAKSRPASPRSRQATIRVITYRAASKKTQISAAICFGVFFFINNSLFMC